MLFKITQPNFFFFFTPFKMTVGNWGAEVLCHVSSFVVD